MAIAFRATSEQAAVKTTSGEVPKPTGVVSGDIMLCFVAVIKGTLTVSMSGWTLIEKLEPGSKMTGALFWKKYEGEAGPYAYTWGGAEAFRSATIVAYSGVSGTPVNVHSGASSGSASTKSIAPSVTTTVANTMLVYGSVNEEGNSTTVPAGMTARVNNDAFFSDVAQATAGASGTKEGVITGAVFNAAMLVALAPEEAAVPVVTKPAEQFTTTSTVATALHPSATNTPTAWAASGLPTGLGINASTGEITGTPTAVAGAYTVKLQAENGSGKSAEVSFTWNIEPVVKITAPANQTSHKGTPVTLPVSATGFNLTWKATAAKPLPAGLSINASTGEITGTPTTEEAEHLVGVECESSAGGSDKASWKWTIEAALAGGHADELGMMV